MDRLSWPRVGAALFSVLAAIGAGLTVEMIVELIQASQGTKPSTATGKLWVILLCLLLLSVVLAACAVKSWLVGRVYDFAFAEREVKPHGAVLLALSAVKEPDQDLGAFNNDVATWKEKVKAAEPSASDLQIAKEVIEKFINDKMRRDSNQPWRPYQGPAGHRTC